MVLLHSYSTNRPTTTHECEQHHSRSTYIRLQQLDSCRVLGSFTRNGLLYCMPLPTRSGSNSPASILARIVFEHFRNASSTFSPVLALVSRKISSARQRINNPVQVPCQLTTHRCPGRKYSLQGIQFVLPPPGPSCCPPTK